MSSRSAELNPANVVVDWGDHSRKWGHGEMREGLVGNVKRTTKNMDSTGFCFQSEVVPLSWSISSCHTSSSDQFIFQFSVGK